MHANSRRFTLSLRSTLLTVIVGLLMMTVATVGTVTYVNDTDSIQNLAMALGRETSTGMADRVRGLLAPAQTVLLEWRTLARRGMLPVDDHEALVLRFAERLRYIPHMDWLSYGDRDGRFSGAWRRDDGQILINRSWYGSDGRVHMVEEIIHEDGSRQLLRTSDRWDYDPRTRPFYTLASASDDLVWTAPYDWWDRVGLGVTAAIALRDEQGVRGVFTADFHLDNLSEYLHHTAIGQTGRVFLLTRAGQVIAGPRRDQVDDVVLDAALRTMPVKLDALPLDQPAPHAFTVDGIDYAMVTHAFDVPGGIEWATLMVVPSHELFGYIERNFTLTAVVVAVVVVLAIALAVILAARITRPLATIADELQNVARFDLSGQAVLPGSHIREMRVVSEVTARMKASLRSFSRYVPRVVVRELLARGSEAQLGVQPRELTIFFSDIENFSGLSEVLTPQDLIKLTSEYFAIIEEAIDRHGGTVDKFIGDGVLAFFNAPQSVENHAGAGCLASLDILAHLPALRRQAQLPVRTRTRIGLHTGSVLVGNIGTANRFNYTVLGDVVNVCYGFQVLSKVYGTELIAGAETRAAAGEGFEWRLLDRVAIKGRAGGGFAYELLGRCGQVSDALRRARDAYELGVHAYLDRRFEDAAQSLRTALEHHADDQPSRVMLARVEAFLREPPPASWTGVYNVVVAPVGKVAFD